MKKVLVIFGGESPEHDVSIVSGIYVAKNIDKNNYHVEKAYIDRKGNWFVYEGKESISFEDKLTNLKEIDNVFKFLKEFDVLFPVLHGRNGEDGRIQGLFELVNIPYVGSKVLGSSLAMDKVYAKFIFDKAGIKQAKYKYVKRIRDGYLYIDDSFNEINYSLKELISNVIKDFKFPIFVKPSNSGSSVGISEAKNEKELEKAMLLAEKYDNKIVIEEGIKGREFECSVLGNESVIASKVGEVISAAEFYDYESKYKNPNSKTIINPDLPKNIEEKMKSIAIKAFKAIDGKGLSRVDFFLDENNTIYLCEINTMPGFTDISMYPKLFEASGVAIKDLLTKLIELALQD